MKAFHKASSIIPFSPVPPAGKGWEYSYPHLLHGPQEQLGSLLRPGTCPKPWSAQLCKQPGLEQLWDVPPSCLPTSFPNTVFRDWSNWEVSPCSILAGMLRPQSRSVLEGTSALVLSLLPKWKCWGWNRLWEILPHATAHTGGSTEWIKQHPPALGKPASKLIHWRSKPKSLWGSSSFFFFF